MPDQTPAEAPEDWQKAGEGVTSGAIGYLIKLEWSKPLATFIADCIGRILSWAYTAMSPIGIGLAKGITKSEDLVAPELAEIAAAAASDLFGTDVPASAFASRRNRGARNQAADGLGAGIINTIKGAGGPLEPSDAAAKRYLTMVLNMSLEGWYQGWMFEFMSSLVPWLDIGKIESFGELDDTLAEALGLGRVTRSVLRPIVDATVVTPLLWQTNKTYRPELLSPSDVVRQVLRGKWTKAEGVEELARQGFSDKRIEALLNAGAKFFGPGDVRTFVAREHWTNEQAIQHLKDQGYDDAAAHNALRLEGLKRFDQLESQEANALIGAYAARDISRADFLSALEAHVPIASERALFTELAELRRVINVKHLSTSQVEAMVKSGVANIRDYRDAAIGEGYDDDDVTMLELQLRWEMDKDKKIEQHRAELEAERAAAKALRDQELAARKAQLERERAFARRGTEADLERAAIRGQIPIARVEEVYAAHYDDDTVAILIRSLEDDRQAYVDQQKARDEALKRGARRSIDVGAVTAAYNANLLTSVELRARLASLGFDDADADLLTATAIARKAELDAAAAKRAAAEKTAKARQVDLGRFERLVRRGARSMAQYVALLEQLDVDEAAIPDFVEALQLQIDDDAAAAAARAAAEPELKARGLSIEQMRRAVLLELRTVDDYQAFLVANRFTSDAQAVLLAELRADVADAEAARQRRSAPAPVPATPGSPLSTIRRAAQLGVVSPDVYLDRLAAAGYSAEDLAIELDLLLTEIADVQAQRRQRSETIPTRDTPGLSLDTIARAVKAGTTSIGAYRSRAVELGYSLADIDVLAALVERELETLSAGRTAHGDVAFRLAPQGLSVAELDAAAKDGSLTLDDYVAQLEAWGVASGDAQLVGAFLAWTLEQTPTTGGT